MVSCQSTETERTVWANHYSFSHVTGTAICLSCLLEAGRYGELQELLAIRRVKFWSWHRFGAEALARQGLWEAAIAYAVGARDSANSSYDERAVDRFCENILIQRGHSDEAYRRFGLRAASGTTNVATYRSLVRTYPDRDSRQILLDLIETRDDKGKWFAAAKDAGFLDIAIECASLHGADPSTLVRAARDYCGTEPNFAATVALLAIRHLLAGGGYDPRVSEVDDAVGHLIAAARKTGTVDWARGELGKLAGGSCSSGREMFHHALKEAMLRHEKGGPNI